MDFKNVKSDYVQYDLGDPWGVYASVIKFDSSIVIFVSTKFSKLCSKIEEEFCPMSKVKVRLGFI